MALTGKERPSEGVAGPPENLTAVFPPAGVRRGPLSQKPWTVTLRKTFSWGLVWGEEKNKGGGAPRPTEKNQPGN